MQDSWLAGLRHIRAAVLAVVMCAFAGCAWAQWVPERPIKLIVPFAPGAATDISARTISDRVAAILGQPIVIENQGAASGVVGTEAGARAQPNGYTWTLAHDPPFTILPHVRKLNYDPLKDFDAVAVIASIPMVLVVRPDLPVNSVPELVALARANPGKLTFGSSGNGAINHLAGQLFASMADVKLTHIPYKGGAPAASAVMSGEIDMIFGEPATLLPFVESGRLRAIATTGAKRSVGMPDLPTIAESGVPGYDVTSWNGVLAPAGTPPDVIARLNAAFNKVLAEPEMRARLVKIGYEPVGGAPERFSQKIERETRKWGPVIKEAGLQMN